MLVGKRDPFVRNDGSKKQGMGSAAFRAANPADPQRDGSLWEENPPLIVSVDRKTGGVPAGACKLVELEIVYDGIVVILRKLVVITDRNEYHGLVRHSPKWL